MSFEKDKERTLNKMTSNDKSNKGFVDKPVKKLIDKINKSKNYYSTSSCSGRIILIQIPESGSKKEAEFIYRTHDKAKLKDVLAALKDVKGNIWLRQEPVILHVCAKTLEDASKLLRAARLIGYKRCGLFEIEKRFLMELMSTEKIDAIIAKEGKLLVSEDYLKVLIDAANKKLERTWGKIKKLESKF
ncbi:hypothetical protein HQ533_02020 [Candidatus Woesearchaeota archaeon]|nr:hypothetical protein [Candidatus Woesearchaeota archaeon]